MLSACRTAEKRTILAWHNVNFTSYQRKQINPKSIRLKIRLFYTDFWMSLYSLVMSQTPEVRMMQVPLHVTFPKRVE